MLEPETIIISVIVQKTTQLIFSFAYRSLPIPQALGSSGAHIGVGSALLRAMETFAAVDADEIWVVEAKAPVMTRAATAVRTMSFMIVPFWTQLFMR
jgi:hypothetical protein